MSNYIDDGIDPLAQPLESFQTSYDAPDCFDLEDESLLPIQGEATWEHEDLAKVRIKVLRGHTDGVNSCQFFANETKILTCSSDRSIRIWDFDSGKVLRCSESVHEIDISVARVSPDNKRFLSVGWDKKIHVWDLPTGKWLWTGQHDGVVTSGQFSHDGKMIVTGSDLENDAKIWDVHNGEILHTITDSHKKTITSCIFTPHNDRIVTTSMDMTTKFWDMRSLTTTLTLEGHFNIVSSCAMTKDERKFATTSWDKTVKLWDIPTGMYRTHGAVTLSKGHEGSISCCQFSEDAMTLITGAYDTNIVVWDVNNVVQKLTLQGHGDWVTGVDITKDQKWLLSCSKDMTVRLWNIEESDKIPVVLENRRSIGLKIVKCSNCGKPFSMGQMESLRDTTVCVFCRLQQGRDLTQVTLDGEDI